MIVPRRTAAVRRAMQHLREVLADPHHEEHDRLRKWVGELPAFDREATDLLVRQTVGEVPESVRLLLDLLAGGVKLTPGGRLPRSVVRAVQERRPEWYPLDRPASIEEDLYPLAVLHDIVRKVGLARLANGVLRPTRAAADDREVVRRLRTWFEPEGFSEHPRRRRGRGPGGVRPAPARRADPPGGAADG